MYLSGHLSLYICSSIDCILNILCYSNYAESRKMLCDQIRC